MVRSVRRGVEADGGAERRERRRETRDEQVPTDATKNDWVRRRDQLRLGLRRGLDLAHLDCLILTGVLGTVNEQL